MRDEVVNWTVVRTLDPFRILLGDFVDDFFREPPLPLGLSDLVWVALFVDEVEDVEGHGGDVIDYRIGKLEFLRGRWFRLSVVHKSCRLVQDGIHVCDQFPFTPRPPFPSPPTARRPCRL